MKSIKILLLLSVVNLSTAIAQEPSEDEVNAMEKIVFTCKRMPTITFPLPDRDGIEMYNFKSYTKRIKDTLSEYPTIEHSNYNVNGKAFNSIFEPCMNKIKTTETKLYGNSSAQQKVLSTSTPTTHSTNHVIPTQTTTNTTPTVVNNRPNEKARDHLRGAFMLCDTAKHLKEKGKLSDKKISLLYDHYHRAIEKAQAEDSRVNNWKKETIAECNQLITQQYLVIEEKKREAKALAEASQRQAQLEREAQSKKEDETREKEKEEDFQRRLTRAKSLGYKSLEQGITIFLAKLKHNDLSMSSAKTSLVLKSYKDRFKVSSIVGNQIIYSYMQEGFDDFRIKQIAVAKIANRFYEEDTPLPAGYYAFTGVREFTTVLGATKQIAMFKMVEEFH